MKYLLIIIPLLFSSLLLAQDVNMQTASINQCGGVFYDSGGEFGFYSDNEDFTLTICPENAGQKVQIYFTFFTTQLNQDIMSIFNGDTTAADSFGDFSGTNSPGLVQATQDNASGCITIQFVSNASGNIDGWAANISCLTPCQTINSQIDSTSPAPNANNYLRVCTDEEITLTGSGTFSIDGTGATYEWDLGDGNIASGQTATFSYPTPGVYIVNLNIRDANTSIDPLGCDNNNLINQVIQVSTEPDFTGSEAAKTTICFGDSTDITGVVEAVEFINDCTPPVSGVTFLPDGNGVTYETSVTVDCYDSAQTLTDESQLVSICLTMEHSYLGDLDIQIISPNGQIVTLKDYPGGGSANLGIPWATGTVDGQSSNTTPGTGSQYCFVPNGGFPTLVGGIQSGGTFPNGDGPGTYDDQYVAAGNYSSEESLAGLLGSPLNGDWTIRVVDNLSADNGHMFAWSIRFDPALQPPELSFTPVITSEAWDSDPTITNTTGNVITVLPTTAGQFCYTYRATDDFGCEYTEEVCIDVLPEIVTENPNNLFVCDTGAPPYIFDLESNTAVILASATNAADLVVSYHNSLADANADVGAILVTGSYTGADGETVFIRVEYLESGCYEVLSFTLNVAGRPTINPASNLELCDDAANDGSEEFDLSTQDTSILGSQSATDFNVTYYLTFTDADAGTNALPNLYTNAANPEPLFVRVENVGDSSCYNALSTAVFNLQVNPRAIANTPMNLELCDDLSNDGLATFDLSTQESDILGTQNPTIYNVSFHNSQTDADDNLSALPKSYTNSNPNVETVFVRVENPLLPACYSTTSFDLVVNPLPSLVSPSALEVCDDGTPDGLTEMDLSVKDLEVTGNNSNYVVSYYVSQADADSEINQLPNPYTNTLNGQIVYVRVEDINTSCYNTTTLELVVQQAPIAFTPEPLRYCDPDNDGFGVFMLTDADNEITGGAAGLTVTYHETLDNANTSMDAIDTSSNYTNIVVNTQTLYARIESASIATDCATIIELQLIVEPTPQLVNPTPLAACDDISADGFATFNLTTKDVELLNGQDPTQYIVSYYTTQTNAEAGNNPIANPASYTNTTASNQEIWIRVEDNTTVEGCYKTTSLELIVNPLPVLAQASPLELCDVNNPGDEQEAFTLEDANAEILNGQTGITLTHYETQADAENATSPIVSAYNNTSAVQTIFVRAENMTTGCYDTTTFTIRVNPIPSPTPSEQLQDLELCDEVNAGDGMEVFDLTENEIMILNGQTGVTPTYYENAEDAESGVNPIPDPTQHTNTNTPEHEIYVRVTNDVTSCYAIVNFTIIVHPLPDVIAVTDFIQCELNTDGFDSFDLTTKDVEVLNGQDPAQFIVTYHQNITDAESAMNGLVSPYNNLSNPQQIYVTITNNITGCSISTQRFNIQVDEAAEANSDMNPILYQACDDNMETDGNPDNDSTQFDLSTIDLDILDGQDPLNYILTYYATEEDANLNVNPLPTLYENIVNPQVIYARVDNDTPDIITGADTSICYAVATFTLQVNPLPEYDLEDSYILCVNSDGTEVVAPLVIETGLSTTNYSFEWSYNEDILVAETGSSLMPSQGGTYSVTVTDLNTSSETNCTNTDSTEVIESEPPLLEVNLVTQAFSDNHVIEALAIGIGVYEYSLDGGPWQDEGIFSNVSAGTHEITTRDKNGCGLASDFIFVIDYPLYFTPNGDGNHDTWNIPGIGSSAKIYIFDRYGKLLKQLSPTGSGWNGTFNGHVMPTSDYWFMVEYNEPMTDKRKEYKAHFTLKR